MNLRSLSRSSAALALSAGLLVGCSDDPEPTAADPNVGSDASSSPTEPVASSPSDVPSPTETSTPRTKAQPVYFVGDTPQGPRLFREFRAIEDDNPLEEAVALLGAGDTLDPDYYTLLPPLDVKMIGLDEERDVIVVYLEDDAVTSDKSLTPAQGRLAVQSLVYTLQGVSQTRDPVEVVAGPDNTPVTILGVDTSNGVRARPQLDVLGLVNVTSPEEGATVSGTFSISGVASSFEANVPWQVRKGDEVVLDGFTTASNWIDKLYPWRDEVDVSGLEPGTYTFAALTDDPSDGEGAGPTEDTKTITVE